MNEDKSFKCQAFACVFYMCYLIHNRPRGKSPWLLSFDGSGNKVVQWPANIHEASKLWSLGQIPIDSDALNHYIWLSSLVVLKV